MMSMALASLGLGLNTHSPGIRSCIKVWWGFIAVHTHHGATQALHPDLMSDNSSSTLATMSNQKNMHNFTFN